MHAEWNGFSKTDFASGTGSTLLIAKHVNQPRRLAGGLRPKLVGRFGRHMRGLSVQLQLR